MKKLIAITCLLLNTTSYAASITVPNFKIKLIAASSEVDLSKVSVNVRDVCAKKYATEDGSASVFDNRHPVTKISDSEYEVHASKIKCSGLYGVYMHFEVYINGKYIFRQELDGYDNIVVNSEDLARSFDEAILIDETK